MLKYIIGALIGGVAGYIILYRVIGCSSGACPITANPYISIIYGIIMGVLISGTITFSPKNQAKNEPPQKDYNISDKM